MTCQAANIGSTFVMFPDLRGPPLELREADH
jgi:hypothetical protein